jgi:hypothetical protein
LGVADDEDVRAWREPTAGGADGERGSTDAAAFGSQRWWSMCTGPVRSFSLRSRSRSSSEAVRMIFGVAATAAVAGCCDREIEVRRAVGGRVGEVGELGRARVGCALEEARGVWEPVGVAVR